MRKVGIVRSIKSNVAEIRAATEDECAHCPLQDSCSSGISNKNGTILARNSIGAEAGDLVEFEYEERDIIKGIFTIYMIPFFFLVIGLIIGLIFEKGLNIHIGKLENMLSVLISVGFLFIGIFVVKKKDENFLIPSRIVSVISKGFYIINY
jgi:sigma-E factor negative regulatory protein RseC